MTVVRQGQFPHSEKEMNYNENLFDASGEITPDKVAQEEKCVYKILLEQTDAYRDNTAGSLSYYQLDEDSRLNPIAYNSSIEISETGEMALFRYLKAVGYKKVFQDDDSGVTTTYLRDNTLQPFLILRDHKDLDTYLDPADLDNAFNPQEATLFAQDLMPIFEQEITQLLDMLSSARKEPTTVDVTRLAAALNQLPTPQAIKKLFNTLYDTTILNNSEPNDLLDLAILHFEYLHGLINLVDDAWVKTDIEAAIAPTEWIPAMRAVGANAEMLQNTAETLPTDGSGLKEPGYGMILAFINAIVNPNADFIVFHDPNINIWIDRNNDILLDIKRIDPNSLPVIMTPATDTTKKLESIQRGEGNQLANQFNRGPLTIYYPHNGVTKQYQANIDDLVQLNEDLSKLLGVVREKQNATIATITYQKTTGEIEFNQNSTVMELNKIAELNQTISQLIEVLDFQLDANGDVVCNGLDKISNITITGIASASIEQINPGNITIQLGEEANYLSDDQILKSGYSWKNSKPTAGNQEIAKNRSEKLNSYLFSIIKAKAKELKSDCTGDNLDKLFEAVAEKVTFTHKHRYLVPKGQLSFEYKEEGKIDITSESFVELIQGNTVKQHFINTLINIEITNYFTDPDNQTYLDAIFNKIESCQEARFNEADKKLIAGKLFDCLYDKFGHIKGIKKLMIEINNRYFNDQPKTLPEIAPSPHLPVIQQLELVVNTPSKTGNDFIGNGIPEEKTYGIDEKEFTWSVPNGESIASCVAEFEGGDNITVEQNGAILNVKSHLENNFNPGSYLRYDVTASDGKKYTVKFKFVATDNVIGGDAR